MHSWHISADNLMVWFFGDFPSANHNWNPEVYSMTKWHFGGFCLVACKAGPYQLQMGGCNPYKWPYKLVTGVYNPCKWGYNPIYNWFLGPRCEAQTEPIVIFKSRRLLAKQHSWLHFCSTYLHFLVGYLNQTSHGLQQGHPVHQHGNGKLPISPRLSVHPYQNKSSGVIWEQWKKPA